MRPVWTARSSGSTSSRCPTSTGARTSRPTARSCRGERGYDDAGYARRRLLHAVPLGDVVGDLALGLPEWRAAGQTSQAEALDRCGDDWQIQGGEAVLGQWVEAGRDLNVTCPGITDLGRWFRQY